eukprot:2778135-Rhodomonas_salina.1
MMRHKIEQHPFNPGPFVLRHLCEFATDLENATRARLLTHLLEWAKTTHRTRSAQSVANRLPPDVTAAIAR